MLCQSSMHILHTHTLGLALTPAPCLQDDLLSVKQNLTTDKAQLESEKTVLEESKLQLGTSVSDTNAKLKQTRAQLEAVMGELDATKLAMKNAEAAHDNEVILSLLPSLCMNHEAYSC